MCPLPLSSFPLAQGDQEGPCLPGRAQTNDQKRGERNQKCDKKCFCRPRSAVQSAKRLSFSFPNSQVQAHPFLPLLCLCCSLLQNQNRFIVRCVACSPRTMPHYIMCALRGDPTPRIQMTNTEKQSALPFLSWAQYVHDLFDVFIPIVSLAPPLCLSFLHFPTIILLYAFLPRGVRLITHHPPRKCVFFIYPDYGPLFIPAVSN